MVDTVLLTPITESGVFTPYPEFRPIKYMRRPVNNMAKELSDKLQKFILDDEYFFKCNYNVSFLDRHFSDIIDQISSFKYTETQNFNYYMIFDRVVSILENSTYIHERHIESFPCVVDVEKRIEYEDALANYISYYIVDCKNWQILTDQQKAIIESIDSNNDKLYPDALTLYQIMNRDYLIPIKKYHKYNSDSKYYIKSSNSYTEISISNQEEFEEKRSSIQLYTDAGNSYRVSYTSFEELELRWATARQWTDYY